MAAELAHEGQITKFKKEDHIKLSKKYFYELATVITLKTVLKMKHLKGIRRHSR